MTSSTVVVPPVHAYCCVGSWPFGWVYLVDFDDLDICCPFFRYRYTHIIFLRNSLVAEYVYLLYIDFCFLDFLLKSSDLLLIYTLI